MEQAETSDEAAWIRQAQAGSLEAFGRLVRQHEAAVRWHLIRALRDAAAADDLAQEVFLCVYQRLGEYRGEGSLRAWLLGIARNLALQHIRAAARRRSREEGPLQMQLAQWRMERLARDPWDDADQERTFALLHECLDRLAPESRRVVEEHYFDRQSIAAIAQRQGRTGGAVRMMLLRIRRALGDCLGNRLKPEG